MAAADSSAGAATPVQIRLSWLLKAPQPYEDAYWTSNVVNTTLYWLDLAGHLMSMVGMCGMLCLVQYRAVALNQVLPLAFVCLVAASLLQVCFMQLRPVLYQAMRQQLAWANRLTRLLLLLGPILQGNFDVINKLLPTEHIQELELSLLGHVCLLPLMHFYGNLCFVVPAATLLLMQLPATVLIASLAVHSHQSLGRLPGMQQLADSVCDHVRGVFELTLHWVVDQGTLPGVPAAGFDAWGTPSRCSGQASFLQLMLFADLTLTYFLPVYITYMAELRHKRLFWECRTGLPVKVQASPLLPFPSNHLASHCCVVVCMQLLLWFLAELLTGVLV